MSTELFARAGLSAHHARITRVAAILALLGACAASAFAGPASTANPGGAQAIRASGAPIGPSPAGPRTHSWERPLPAFQPPPELGTGTAEWPTDSPFSFGERYSLGTHGVSAAIEDFDSDGFADVAVLEYSAERVTIWINDGSGRLVQRHVFASGSDPLAVVAADFDADGKADLAVMLDESPGEVAIFKGHGDGTFEATASWPAGSTGEGLAVGDVDGDGRPDLVVANYGGSSITVLRNLGNGFAPGVPYGDTPIRGSPAIADFDRDGHPDIAAPQAGFNSVFVFRNLGDGTFAPPVETMTQQGETSTSAGDLDGDGWPDLAFMGYGDFAEILWNDGAGGFSGGSILPGRAGYSGAVTIADFDADGRLDLAFSSYAGYDGPTWMSVALARGAHDGWARVDYLVQNDYPSETLDFLSAKDLDGDHLPDLIGVGGERVYYDDQPGHVSVIRHTSRSLLNGLTDYVLASDVLGAWSMTRDDGRPTIMVRTDTGDRLLTAGPEGMLGAPEDFPAGADAFFADVNTDGIPDVILPHGDSLDIHPSGGLPLHLPRPPGSQPILALADFNGDHHLDYLVGGGDSVAVAFHLHGDVYTNPIPVHAELPPPAGYTSRVFAPADFDGDGLDDLAVGYLAITEVGLTDSLIFLRSEGHGVFSIAGGAVIPECNKGYSCFSYPQEVLPADVDGDGRIDLVLLLGVEDWGEIWVFRNLGDFRFAPVPEFYHTIKEGPTLCVHDFNGDQLPDLAVFTYNDNEGVARFELRKNLGGGYFEAPGETHPIEHYVASLAISDLNRDGKTDLVFSYRGYRYQAGVSTLINQSPDGTPAHAPIDRPASPANGVQLAAIQPNPSAGPMSVRFSLPSAEPAAIELLDLLGRRVQIQRMERATPGLQSVELAHGRSLAAGVYWVRVSQAGRSAAKKAVVIR